MVAAGRAAGDGCALRIMGNADPHRRPQCRCADCTLGHQGELLQGCRICLKLKVAGFRGGPPACLCGRGDSSATAPWGVSDGPDLQSASGPLGADGQAAHCQADSIGDVRSKEWPLLPRHLNIKRILLWLSTKGSFWVTATQHFRPWNDRFARISDIRPWILLRQAMNGRFGEAAPPHEHVLDRQQRAEGVSKLGGRVCLRVVFRAARHGGVRFTFARMVAR